MTGHRTERATRWIEMIHLRSSRGALSEVAQRLEELLPLRGEERGFATVVEVRLWDCPSRETDLGVLLYHETQGRQRPDMGLGQLVLELCQERGLVRRTLWRERTREVHHDADE